MTDETPDPLAALDQMLRGLFDVARSVRAYHVALVAQGFTEDQALHLTTSWQTTILTLGSQQ